MFHSLKTRKVILVLLSSCAVAFLLLSGSAWAGAGNSKETAQGPLVPAQTYHGNAGANFIRDFYYFYTSKANTPITYNYSNNFSGDCLFGFDTCNVYFNVYEADADPTDLNDGIIGLDTAGDASVDPSYSEDPNNRPRAAGSSNTIKLVNPGLYYFVVYGDENLNGDGFQTLPYSFSLAQADGLGGPPGNAVIDFPPKRTKRCKSKRKFRIHIKQVKGFEYASAQVFVNGRSSKVIPGTRLSAGVNLRGFPYGKFTVKIVVKTTSGIEISGTRKYKTCRKFRGPAHKHKI